MTPPISIVLAQMICWDDYTSEIAADSPSWAGAPEHARAGAWQDPSDGAIWVFCHDPETGRIDAVDADGAAYFGSTIPARKQDGWTRA